MKVKSYIATDINQALQQVKEEIGDGAVILAQQETPKGLLLTVGWDDSEVELKNNISFINKNKLQEILDYHGIIDTEKHKIIASVPLMSDSNSRTKTNILAQALEKYIRFTPLLESESNLQMFMGTPGAGKSTAIAKVATYAKMKGLNVAVISTDNLRAGANIQLKSFAEILDVDFYFYRDPQQLFSFIKEKASKYQRVFIDTPGINPFLATEVDKVSSFADVLKGDKILIADAGRNVDEAVEVADIFKSLGAKMLLPTRLDLTRRLGSVISIASKLSMSICGATVSSSIAKGYVNIDANTLSSLLAGYKDN